MKKVIIIPARLQSVRLPQKPLAFIENKTMIEHVLERAQRAEAGEVYVACCAPEIKEIVERAGGRALLTDPNLPSGTDRVFAAASQLTALEADDIVVNLQGDLPLINPSYIKKAAQLLEEMPQANITTLAAPIENEEEVQTPSVVKVAFTPSAGTPLKGQAHYFSRSPIPHGAQTFFHHIGIYAFRYAGLEKFVKAPPSYLETTERLEQLRALDLGQKIWVEIVEEAPQSVDTPEDLEKVRTLAAQIG